MLRENNSRGIEITFDEGAITIVDKQNGHEIARSVTTCEETVANAFELSVTSCVESLMEKTGTRQEINEDKAIHLENSKGAFCGIVGKPTHYKDALGRAIYVGDVVETFDENGRSRGNHFMIQTMEDGAFVMGLKGRCDPKEGHIDGFYVLQRIKFKDVTRRDDYDGIGCY